MKHKHEIGDTVYVIKDIGGKTPESVGTFVTISDIGCRMYKGVITKIYQIEELPNRLCITENEIISLDVYNSDIYQSLIESDLNE